MYAWVRSCIPAGKVNIIEFGFGPTMTWDRTFLQFWAPTTSSLIIDVFFKAWHIRTQYKCLKQQQNLKSQLSCVGTSAHARAAH